MVCKLLFTFLSNINLITSFSFVLINLDFIIINYLVRIAVGWEAFNNYDHLCQVSHNHLLIISEPTISLGRYLLSLPCLYFYYSICDVQLIVHHCCFSCFSNSLISSLTLRSLFLRLRLLLGSEHSMYVKYRLVSFFLNSSNLFIITLYLSVLLFFVKLIITSEPDFVNRFFKFFHCNNQQK